uniref:Uncharacterized protein n=1 Tax=Opuntia streptacantha TaxID=393608 RepID=A0A7C9D9R9_OPUST
MLMLNGSFDFFHISSSESSTAVTSLSSLLRKRTASCLSIQCPTTHINPTRRTDMTPIIAPQKWARVTVRACVEAKQGLCLVQVSGTNPKNLLAERLTKDSPSILQILHGT